MAKKSAKNEDHTKEFSQYFTPEPLALTMARLSQYQEKTIRFLDPGAGTGILTKTYVATLLSRTVKPTHLQLIAVENDASLIPFLTSTLKESQILAQQAGIVTTVHIVCSNFLEYAASLDAPVADVITMNPPYRKIRSDFSERQIVHAMGFDTSNIYTAFIFASMSCLAPDGDLISITPRSFCNGVYHKAFRQRYLSAMSLSHLITIDSRSTVFEHVLQETIVMHVIKKTPPPLSVQVSLYSAQHQCILTSHDVAYHRILRPNDTEHFIHVETDQEDQAIADAVNALPTRLHDLHLQVSTGPVVDFRAKEALRDMPEEGSVPLLYPGHFKKNGLVWPQPKGKKPNAILVTEQTIHSLIPNEWYVIIRRFSSREEARRIVAHVYQRDAQGSMIGLENRLNYIHDAGSGLNPIIAWGIATYLNSTIVDDYYRLFGGHTHVNATDLRALPYPTKDQLMALGQQVMQYPELDVDQYLEKEIFHAGSAVTHC